MVNEGGTQGENPTYKMEVVDDNFFDALLLLSLQSPAISLRQKDLADRNSAFSSLHACHRFLSQSADES